jgi:hypothetical protein
MGIRTQKKKTRTEKFSVLKAWTAFMREHKTRNAVKKKKTRGFLNAKGSNLNTLL